MIGPGKSRHCQTWLEQLEQLANENCSESRFELRNLQILKKLLKKSSQFLSSEQPVKLQELRKYPRKSCGCGQPRDHLIRVLNERSICDGGLTPSNMAGAFLNFHFFNSLACRSCLKATFSVVLQLLGAQNIAYVNP